MKSLFIVSLPIEFPASEYGGAVTVIANTKGELASILLKEYFDDWNPLFDPKTDIPDIPEYFDECLSKAKSFLLYDSNLPAGIITQFRT